jgi:sporulation protein YlmC with PRC-barrel domain
MTPDSAIKLVSELIDLPILDQEGKYSGIVDDVELDGAPGKPLKLKALLVGPGAYAGRMPRWAMQVMAWIGADRLTRVPMDKVKTINRAVHLECPGRDLGLHRGEAAVGKWIPRWGAL